jgi:hypothetical protein
VRVTVTSDVAVSPNWDAQNAALTSAYPFSFALPDGGVVCVYRAGREKHSLDGRLLAQLSQDGGRSWSPVQTVFDGRERTPPESVHAGVVCANRRGDLLAWLTTVEIPRDEVYVFSEGGRALPGHLYAYRSADGGRSWELGAEHAVEDAPGKVYVGSRPLLLDDGAILLPLEATGPRGNQLVLCAVSDEEGATLSPARVALEDPTARVSFGDPRVTRLPDGRLYLLSWAFETATEKTLPVHAAESADQGRTWSAPRSTGVESQIMSPLAVGGSVLIAVSTVRVGIAGIRLWRSEDLGESWGSHDPVLLWSPSEERVAGRSLPPAASAGERAGSDPIWNALPSFTFGTPDLLFAGEEILHTYYATIDGIAHVRACRLRIHPPATDMTGDTP